MAIQERSAGGIRHRTFTHPSLSLISSTPFVATTRGAQLSRQTIVRQTPRQAADKTGPADDPSAARPTGEADEPDVDIQEGEDPEEDAEEGVRTLPGVGPKLLAKIVRAFGSEEAFLQACHSGEVDRIAEVSGIGPQRAVDLVHSVRGTTAPPLFGTPRVAEIFERIRDTIAARACTRPGRNELRLLAPLRDRVARTERLRWAEAAGSEIEGLDLEAARRHLRVIRPLPPVEPAFEATWMVFVDSAEDEEALLEAGIDRWAPVVSARDQDAAIAAEAGIYAYSDGDAALLEAEHILSVPFTTDLAKVVPWAITARFQKARASLDAAAALSLLRGRPSPAREAVEALGALPARGDALDARTLEVEATEALAAALKEAESALQQVSFSAADLVRAMNREAPRALQEAYHEAVRHARRILAAKVGLECDPYTDTLPPRVDPEAVREAVESQRRLGAGERLERIQRVAVLLAKLGPRIEEELADHARFDARQALGSYVREHSLSTPEWGEGLVLHGALHLDHSPDGERVDYRLGLDATGVPRRERLALLTGANSGGKTTLLETIAQVVVLAHAGLPVPATRAVVPELDSVHFYAERRSLGAGAFETFLRRFFPLVETPGKMLLLADELEAMTELEAAAEILAAFLERLATREALGVLATHMAPHIVPAVAEPARSLLRVDGIEARGLDAEGRLIVDRTPRLGVRARSTPELILRRLAQHGPDELKEVFADLAERVARARSDV